MTGLPSGWRWVKLGDVAAVQGGIQKQAKRRPKENKYPFLRVANVARGSLNLHEIHEIELFEGELERFRLAAGDLLVVEGNGSADQIGRAATWQGAIDDCVHQNHLIRVRPGEAIHPEFLAHVWNSPTIARHLTQVASSSSGLYTLSTRKLRAVQLPLCSLSEQRRIVSILEEHLSRLETAVSYLRNADRRLRASHKSLLMTAIPDVDKYSNRWRKSTVADVGSVELGRQRHPDWHTGANMRPYLRVANVFEDEIRLSDVKTMHWPGETFTQFSLDPGDVLLNEGQSPELLGRPAIYRGEPGRLAFTNTLVRFKANNFVLPEFALLVFRRHMHSGRFTKESRITTNIAHLSTARLKAVEFPVPSLTEQAEIVMRTDALLEGNRHVRSAIDAAGRRQEALRRALLAAAFSGRLTGRSSDVDHAEELASSGAAP